MSGTKFITFGSSSGVPYWRARRGAVSGTYEPRWHVKHVTFSAPPKLLLLIPLIITIIWRARWILGVATENASRLKTASFE